MTPVYVYVRHPSNSQPVEFRALDQGTRDGPVVSFELVPGQGLNRLTLPADDIYDLVRVETLELRPTPAVVIRTDP